MCFCIVYIVYIGYFFVDSRCGMFERRMDLKKKITLLGFHLLHGVSWQSKEVL